LEQLFEKLNALDAQDFQGEKKNYGQLDMNGEEGQKQQKLEEMFGGDGGDDDEKEKKDLTLADFFDKGTKADDNPKQNQMLDTVLEADKDDEMLQSMDNLEDKETNALKEPILPMEPAIIGDGTATSGGNLSTMTSAAKTEQLPAEVTWKIIQMMKRAAKFRQHSESIFLAVGKILASYGFTGTYQPEMHHNMVKESDLSSNLLPKGLKNFWDGSKAAGI